MIKEFIEYEQKIKAVSENTLTAYEKDMWSFFYYVKAFSIATRWSEITKKDIDTYMMFLADNKKAPATRRRKLSSIRAFYNYGMKQGYIEANPARYCESPRLAKQLPNTIETDAIKHYTTDQTKPLTLRIIIQLLYETGIRISELTAIETSDIDYEQHTIRINGKGNKERIVYYTANLGIMMKDYAAGRRGKLFQGADQCQREIRYEIWKALHTHATNGKASPHTIRHTFATEMLRNGMPISTLQTLMGHTNIETTRNYARISSEQVKRDYQAAMH